jgi:hypothetical protein
MNEITITYGNVIQLTTVGEKNKQVFLKISPAFTKKQLKELKGAPLSVFISYALHTDENGYTWVDDKTIKQETGYTITTDIRIKLIKFGYLYQERLRNKSGQLKDYIYRIFQPVEPNKEFTIRNEKLYTPAQEKPCSGENPIPVKSPPVIEVEPSLKEELNSNNNSIMFNYETKQWKNITDEDIKDWSVINPHCDIEAELEHMRQWLLDDKKRAKKHYRKFIAGWIKRTGKKGFNNGRFGTNRQQDSEGSQIKRKDGIDRTEDFKRITEVIRNDE